jgi:hypothetical protein
LLHACRDFWGRAADRLERALSDPSSLPPAGAPTLRSEAAYQALHRARADLCGALGVDCPPPSPWRGGGGEPVDLRSAALALCGGLAADRADPLGQHDATGTAWLVTGGADAEAVARGRRLLVHLERAFTGP